MTNRKKNATIFEKVTTIYGIPISKEHQTDEMRTLLKRVLKEQETSHDMIAFLQKRNRELEIEKETNLLTSLPNQVALTKRLSAVINERNSQYNEINNLKKLLNTEDDLIEKSYLQTEIEDRTSVVEPYTVVFCDLNHFGQYNDRFGDLAVDGLIQKIALLLGQGIRQASERGMDFIARSKTEGDEFVILMPGALAGKAMDRMEVVGNSIASKKFFIETPEKKYFLVSNITIAFGCYQLDAKVKETGIYDKDYFEVLHNARKLMKGKKEAMKLTGETILNIREITNDAELHNLQGDTEIIKVYPVDIGKMKFGVVLQ